MKLQKNFLWMGGHSACKGCGVAIAAKIIIQTIGKKCIVIMPPSCLSVFTIVPYCNLGIPATTCLFASSAAVAAGISDLFQSKGKKGAITVLAGDGGTADIGLQSLSGALYRRHNILYICLNNQGYQNTGNQYGSLSPMGAKSSYGNVKLKSKNLFGIVCKHNPSYAATASVGFPFDLVRKIKKALKIKGPKFIEVLCPCPTGWKFNPRYTIKIAKLAVECGFFPLKEFYKGREFVEEFTTTNTEKKRKEFFILQGRFKEDEEE